MVEPTPSRVRRLLRISERALALTGLFFLVFHSGFSVSEMSTRTKGSTPGMRIDRERQQRCMELRITPAELAALEQRELEAGR